MRKRTSVSTIVLSMLILGGLVMGLMNPLTATAQGPVGFRALAGKAAESFRLPPGLEKKSSTALPQQGLTADRYQQRHGKALVLGGQLTIYRNAATGKNVAVIGAHYANLAPRNQVKLNSRAAQAIVARQIGQDGEWFTDLMLDPATGTYFYRVENQRFDSRWFYWVDAATGKVLNAYNGLNTDGWGIGVLGDVKDLTGLTTCPYGAYQMVTPDNRQKTYDARNYFFYFRLPGTLAADTDDVWDRAGRTSPGQPALVDAHFYARVTDNYYRNKCSFDWLDHYGQGIITAAHFRSNWVNAQWTGTYLIFGDGDGDEFLELSGALDVVAHEFSHGVTEATSELIYQNESGALNESFSDIMGTSVEFYYGPGDWTCGEDITPQTNGLRNMADPNEDGDPSHYADRFIGFRDNGGVHTNSGIANHWFYLLVNGGQNANPARASGTDVVGIGLDAAEEIVFLAFTALPANATFSDARAATIAVAGPYAPNVADAWDEVGVTDGL